MQTPLKIPFNTKPINYVKKELKMISFSPFIIILKASKKEKKGIIFYVAFCSRLVLLRKFCRYAIFGAIM
jgi:hypothetical protein